MNNRFLMIAPILACGTFFLAGCSEDNSSYETPNLSDIATNPGIVSYKNFSLLASETQPTVIDPDTGIFTETDVVMTAYVGDRYNGILTDKHTVFFKTEYGTLSSPSCVTEEGSCEVTWKAIKRPEAGGPGDDMRVTIIAYTIGEESFTDTNGNGIFDDADSVFVDLEEPYVDADELSLIHISEPTRL